MKFFCFIISIILFQGLAFGEQPDMQWVNRCYTEFQRKEVEQIVAQTTAFNIPIPFTKTYFSRPKISKEVTKGTFFCINYQGSLLGMTVRHNIESRDPQKKLTHFYISTELYDIAEKGVFPINETRYYDIVLLKPKDVSSLSLLRPFSISNQRPKINQKVTLFGYEKNGQMAQMKEAKISSFDGNTRMMAINTTIEPGFSGGVVLNEEEQVVGVISSTDGKQAFAVYVDTDFLSSAIWSPLVFAANL